MKPDEKKIQEFYKGFRTEASMQLEKKAEVAIRSLGKWLEALRDDLQTAGNIELAYKVNLIGQRFMSPDNDLLTRLAELGENLSGLWDMILSIMNDGLRKKMQSLVYDYMNIAEQSGDKQVQELAVRLADKSLSL